MTKHILHDIGVRKMEEWMKRIAVLTSGGDAPGMNAAIRSVGLLRGEIAATPLADVIAKRKPLDTRLLELARVLAQ